MNQVVDIAQGVEGASDMQVVDHPHVVDVQREIVFDGGRWKHMLIVLTDLPLDPKAEGYDIKTLDQVIQTVAGTEISRKSGYHGIVIRNP